MTRGSALWLQEVYHQPELRKKLREHRFDVIHLARYRAKKAVEAALRDQGRKGYPYLTKRTPRDGAG